MWPDRISNPVSLTYESGALPTALRGPASDTYYIYNVISSHGDVSMSTGCYLNVLCSLV